MGVVYQKAERHHLDQLVALEQGCFQSDRISKRSFKRFIESPQAYLLLASTQNRLLGYVLLLFHRGTRMARLYSIAVSHAARGQGVASMLLQCAEQQADERGSLYVRLEVSQLNRRAIQLYHKFGYREFAVLPGYYEDNTDALRMQKCVRKPRQNRIHYPVRWYQQTTRFSCGPAALMMAMNSIDESWRPSVELELDLWREATTIYMTSGHGGCHPVGLALAAHQRGVNSRVWLNHSGPLFTDSVRDMSKKQIIETVHRQFLHRAQQQQVDVSHTPVSAQQMQQFCAQGYRMLVLISTFRLDNKKAPHWVMISGYDDECIYLHDPDPDDSHQDPMDCQYVPIAHQDFDKMMQFGGRRLRAVVGLSARE